MTADIVAFVRARLDEDEAWARGASRPYRYADEGAVAPADGVHWRWVAGENWDTVTPDPVASEFVAEPGETCNLATVEEWPSTSWREDGTPIRTWMMPLAYANEIVEMDSAAAGHIARHDPAKVLRRVRADRLILDHVEASIHASGPHLGDTWVLRLLALRYNDHPDYQQEWRP